VKSAASSQKKSLRSKSLFNKAPLRVGFATSNYDAKLLHLSLPRIFSLQDGLSTAIRVLAFPERPGQLPDDLHWQTDLRFGLPPQSRGQAPGGSSRGLWQAEKPKGF
jgi:hypothetical protein